MLESLCLRQLLTDAVIFIIKRDDVTYCKTTGTSFSLIWEPPPSLRQVGKNSSIRLQSIMQL